MAFLLWIQIPPAAGCPGGVPPLSIRFPPGSTSNTLGCPACRRCLPVLGLSIVPPPLGYRSVRYIVLFGRARKNLLLWRRWHGEAVTEEVCRARLPTSHRPACRRTKDSPDRGAGKNRRFLTEGCPACPHTRPFGAPSPQGEGFGLCAHADAFVGEGLDPPKSFNTESTEINGEIKNRNILHPNIFERERNISGMS